MTSKLMMKVPESVEQRVNGQQFLQREEEGQGNRAYGEKLHSK